MAAGRAVRAWEEVAMEGVQMLQKMTVIGSCMRTNFYSDKCEVGTLNGTVI